MEKKKQIISNLKKFCDQLFSYFNKRRIAIVAIGIILGVLIGITLSWILSIKISEVFIALIGAFFGVIAEIFRETLEKASQIKKQLKSLNQVLGTLAFDDIWIYVSAWRRDLSDLDHTRLYRNDPGKTNQPNIIGTQFVYGKGDAIALSYIYQVIEKTSSHERRITVEDSEEMVGSWGRSAICIGAHNSKTRDILAKFSNTYYKFAENYRIITRVADTSLKNEQGISFCKGVMRRSVVDSSDIDYAVILKLKDEYHPDKNILVIAGLGDIGTAGAAYYLLTHYGKLPCEQDTFGILIEVPSGYESAREVEFDKVAMDFIPSKGS